MRQRNRCAVATSVMTVTILASLTGCAVKDLTPSTARELLQKQYESGNQAVAEIPYAPWEAMLKVRYATDYQQDQFPRDHSYPAGSQAAQFTAFGENALHGLLKSGLWEETRGSDSRYSFKPTSRFLESVVEVSDTNGLSGTTTTKMVKLGEVQVNTVSDLLLETEVSATANYTWHLEYSDVGNAIMGGVEKKGNRTAAFRKQPDGVWVCTSK